MSRIATIALDLLKVGGYRSGVLPHSYQLYSPLKIYELETTLAHLALKGRETILDLCCGTGIQTQILGLNSLKVVGIDNDHNKIRDARWHLKHSRLREAVSFIVGQAEEIPLSSRSIDAITCLCAIEHVTKPDDLVHEVFRVLKPGGKFCITADSLANVRSSEVVARHKQMYEVCVYYDRNSLAKVLEGAGFCVDVVFPMLCSDEAVREMNRSMERAVPCGLLETRRLLSAFRQGDANQVGERDGLFVFASARRP